MTAPLRSVIIHGHFYQPPREDPWLDEVETEPSAAPYHDWNQRIERECYRAVVAARLLGAEGRIARIVNTLASISFDVGPTLFEWLEREARSTYDAILEADRLSRERLGGHGNALAMPYHHVILPLASHQDKVTEVRWGIADFRRRYGREPVGMWLPETAVDEETLEVLAAEGIRFTVLAPHQVTQAPPRGAPGLYRTSGGRTIAIFVYDGAVSHDVAFGTLLDDAAAWAERLTEGQVEEGSAWLRAVATDGESYGHHHRFGEMALAAVLATLEGRADVRVENFAYFLERHPATEPVGLVSPSSWSCPHGVERWRNDCGCRESAELPTQQRWRRPLRQGLEWLAGRLHAQYEGEGWELLGDPWDVRDAYGAVVGRSGDAIAEFVDRVLRERGAWSEARSIRARELLEMERGALRMFTSCGWFFNDIAGIETAQILKYAAQAIELAGVGTAALEAGLLERLSQAPGNSPAYPTGREVYERQARPRFPPAVGAAAGYAATRALEAPEATVPRSYAASQEEDLLLLTHRRTGRVRRFRATVERPESPDLAVVVARPDGSAVSRVPLQDLPERARVVARGALRERLVRRWLSPEAIEAVAAGDHAVESEVSRELEGAVAALSNGDLVGPMERVVALVDLLELLGSGVPFEAQTAFFRVRERADPERAAALASLARRLGFV